MQPVQGSCAADVADTATKPASSQTIGVGLGVDSDQYVTLFGSGSVAGADKLLSSAMKRVDNATYAVIADVISGTFTSGNAIYGVIDAGIGLAPFHETDPSVPQSVRDAIDDVRQGISAHTLNIYDGCRTYLFLPTIRK